MGGFGRAFLCVALMDQLSLPAGKFYAAHLWAGPDVHFERRHSIGNEFLFHRPILPLGVLVVGECVE